MLALRTQLILDASQECASDTVEDDALLVGRNKRHEEVLRSLVEEEDSKNQFWHETSFVLYILRDAKRVRAIAAILNTCHVVVCVNHSLRNSTP